MSYARPGEPVRPISPLVWVMLASALLMAAHFIWYDDTPFGVCPTLDGRENLQLAQALASGTSLGEPFYRAPLYPALLSLPLRCGLPAGLLPWAARLLNAVAVLVMALCAGKLAERLWDSRAAAVLTAALVGLNPVIIFFAADPYDILLAAACLSAAALLAVQWHQGDTGKVGLAVGVGLLLGVGALARSHLLLPALCWPILAGSYAKRLKITVASAGGIVLATVGLGLANFAVAGEFRLTPWQGAYNFWAANGPRANGRFFTQAQPLRTGTDYSNPAKAESILAYAADTGRQPPHAIRDMNRHWWRKTLAYIADHPARWVTLMLRKCFSLVHNHEQYDNKTYAFAKRQAPWLRWNPLNWGLLLVPAVAGALLLRRRGSLLL
jgi:hypothetical protein